MGVKVIFICKNCKKEITKGNDLIEIHWTSKFNNSKVAFYCSEKCSSK